MRTGQWIVSILFVAIGSVATNVVAETFTVTPDDVDGWTIIEAAGPGDEVLIAPGTYEYLVFLENAGTADNPIVIRAQDPDNRPVWDMVGDSDHALENADGSYTGGDRGRGAWQVSSEGAHYIISGIVFRNCRGGGASGFRAINSGPVTIRDSLFEDSTNGLTGTSEDLVVEHCEFRENGRGTWEPGTHATHNIYIYGGRLPALQSFPAQIIMYLGN